MRLLTQQDTMGAPPAPAPPTPTAPDSDTTSIASFLIIPAGIIVCLAVFAWVAFKINGVEPGACWSLIKFWKWSDFERQAHARVEEQRFNEYQQFLSTKGVPVVVVMPDNTEVCCAIKDTAPLPMTQCMTDRNSNEDECVGEDAASPSSSSSSSDRGGATSPRSAASSSSIKAWMKRYGFPPQFFVADVETNNDNDNNDSDNKEASCHYVGEEGGAPPSLVAHDSAASLRHK